MRKHTGKGLLHCPLCTKPTTNSYDLKKHVETHQQALVQVLLSMGIVSHVEDCPQLALKALHSLVCTTVQNSEYHRLRKIDPLDVDKIESNALIMDNQKYDCTEKIDMICKSEISRDSEDTESELIDVDVKPQKIDDDSLQAKEFLNSTTNKEKVKKDCTQHFSEVTERLGPTYEPVVVIDTLNDRTNEQPNKEFRKKEKKKLIIEGITPYITVEVLPRKIKCADDIPESGDDCDNFKDSENCQKECTNSYGKLSNKRKVEDEQIMRSCLENDREDEEVKRQKGNSVGVSVKKQNWDELSEDGSNLDEVASIPGGIHEEPVVVLTRLLQHIMESHCRQSDFATSKPTLGDQLVEQCLQVIMNDDVSSEDLPKNVAGDVGLDLRVHRDSSIQSPVRSSDNDIDVNGDAECSKSTNSISMSQNPNFTSSKDISLTVDKDLIASFSDSDMTTLCDQKCITSKSSILPFDSGTVISECERETHIHDSHSIILTDCGNKTLVSNPSVTRDSLASNRSVNVSEEIDSSESSSPLHGRSSETCRNESLPDVAEKSDLQPLDYSCELGKVSCPEKVTFGISKDYPDSKSFTESSDICLDLSLTGMQKGHHQREPSDLATSSHTEGSIVHVHKKRHKNCSSKKIWNHVKKSSDIERPEVHPQNIPLKLRLFRKMNLFRTNEMERCSSIDKNCFSSSDQKRKSQEVRGQEINSNGCERELEDIYVMKGIHDGDAEDCSFYSEGKYKECLHRSGCEGRNEGTSCTKSDCEGGDQTLVPLNAQKGTVPQVVQEDNSESHFQDEKRHLEFNEDYVQKNVVLDRFLGIIPSDQKKAHSLTIRSDEIAPADLSNQSSPSNGIVSLSDRKPLPSVKAKEVSHVWRISQAVLSRPIYPFVERSTKCFSSPSVSVSYKSFVPADGGVEERTCK